MNGRPLRTVLIGLGQIGASYDLDPRTSRYFPYATHASVLESHPCFEWVGACDVSSNARAMAKERWGELAVVDSLAALNDLLPDVAILATGARHRKEILQELRGLRAVICEKPIGMTLSEGVEFVEYCLQNRILLQVNVWRRAEKLMRSLAEGGLRELVGDVQSVICHYGNGVRNNGLHCVDLIRMLVGEFDTVSSFGTARSISSAGVDRDLDVAFCATSQCGAAMSFHPLDFTRYREISFEIWGKRAKLNIGLEGLHCSLNVVGEHRAITNECELVADSERRLDSSPGTAFYELYSNLADGVFENKRLYSDGQSALASQAVVDAVIESVESHGKQIGVKRCPMKSNNRLSRSSSKTPAL